MAGSVRRPRVDYERAAAIYNLGRAGPAGNRVGWWRALAELFGAMPRDRAIATGGFRAQRIVDIGSGTGIWAADLALWFSAEVIAIEPSDGMRANARQAGGVHDAAGRAEALPLADASCDVAWLSTVIHHVDLCGAAAEVARVLVPRGLAIVRSSFPDRAYRLGVNRFFPEAQRVWATFPSTADLCSAFSAVGLALVTMRRVAEPSWGTLEERRQGVVKMRHADTLLAGLTDAEFERGLRRIDAAIAAGEAAPSDGLDLLAFRRERRRT